LRVFLKAIKKHRTSFLSMPGVVSIGLGVKVTRNNYTGIPSLVVGVEKKLPVSDIPSEEIIPRSVDRLPTDVVEVGKIKLIGYALPNPEYPPEDQADIRKKRVRPAQPGVSIGHYKITAGTFGAVVRGNFPGGIAILSNNHILANGTDGRDGLAKIGDNILQPGPYDDGGPRDVIAHLHAFSPMIPEKKEGSKSHLNKIDAALAIPIQPDLVKSTVLGLGPVKGTARAYPGMMIAKSGRSSGITRGLVFSVNNTLKVEGNEKKYIFENQIGTTALSDNGDSGSLMLDRFGRAVGLLFAGSEKQSFFNPINSVLKHFDVSL